MKRAVVTLGHPQHAGMVRALEVLDGAATAHGWSLRYAMPALPPALAGSSLPRERITVIPGLAHWRELGGTLALPGTVLRLRRLARDAHVFYSETLSTLPFCLLAGGLLGIRSVVHVYSSYGSPRPYRKHWLGRARHVVAPSADSLRLASEAVGGFGPDVDARVAYNGMDIPRLEAAASETLPAGLSIPPGPRIGMVGNLDWRKNPRVLVDAAARLRAGVPDLQVLLIGAFPSDEAAEKVRAQVAALGLADCVHVTGFLPNPFPVVRTLDVLVHPALRDPFPLALLEGMALRRAIVASAVGGIPEMLEDGRSGLLVAPDDAALLADAVGGLLRDPSRARALGDAAHERLRTRFSLAGFAATMFAAFDGAARAS
jgi:glycosyltransferase involved in cell wall biosynthesis